MCVRALNDKQRKLSTPIFVDIQSLTDPEVKRSKVKVTRTAIECAAGVGMQVDRTA